MPSCNPGNIGGQERVKAVVDKAAAVLGAEYVDVFLNGPEEKLTSTDNTQPALFTVDGISLSRDTNDVTDVLSGVTFSPAASW